MSATGLDVFDRTLQATNVWLDEMMEPLGPDRQVAWHALGAALRALRDRLPVDSAAHLAAQLPLLVRGLFYDQWHPAGKPLKERTRAEFLAHVADVLRDTRPVDPEDAARAAFAVIARHVSPGEAEKVKHALPDELRVLWPAGGAA
jgi:uncharacterized protein (DUF2267 family)